MDAGLAWTIVGSAAAVVAIPSGLVIGVLQLRQGRTADPADQVIHQRQAHLSLLASTNPKKAIREAWETVREAAQEVARRRAIDWTTTKDLVERLGREKELSSTIVRLMRDLRNLRYDMDHQERQDITPTTANDYVEAAASVADVLRTLP
jgi:hypothetical protein